ncbi:hypothetical protein E4T44_02846 [Aureobasidium sp. EXF-8845]|nr:hypothetical protein E4T44_02846 [Aureobasidium sp. EXF-8845]KAI4855910.1 hypothetical protein E4T45_02639 [Aureobasidium sp. EXF-8846]
MSQSSSSQVSSRVAADATATASASSPTTAATSFSSSANGPSQPKQSRDTPEYFNDPFTGVPSNPPDVEQLFLLCQWDARACCYSIPGSLFFLYFYAQPWSQHKRRYRRKIFHGARYYLLDCPEDQRTMTYIRLSTEWLFSGCAPSSLAKLHRHADGSASISFSHEVRACIYLLRLYTQHHIRLDRACQQIDKICAQDAGVEVSEVSWHNVVMRTEPVEMPTRVWEYAYPTPALPESSLPSLTKGPNTMVQTEHFRGVASLLPSLPDDLPEGWTHWTPITVPELQVKARRKIYDTQYLQSLESVDSVVAAPKHELNVVDQVRSDHEILKRKKITFFSTDTVAGAEEEYDFEANEVDVAQNPRIQLVRTLTQARQIIPPEPARSRKSATPASTKSTTNRPPVRLRLIAPRRPSTPEQAAAFEEAMESDGEEEITQCNGPQIKSSSERSASSEMNQARYLIVMAEALIKKEELEDAGMDTEGVGRSDMAGEDVLFNPLDWE